MSRWERFLHNAGVVVKPSEFDEPGRADRVHGDSVRSEATVMAEKYDGLFGYLEKRYADAMVLTFAQIEDLLGFPLPDSARIDREWWSSDAERDPQPPQALAWTRAGRTATPNLGARTVRFER